MVFETGTWEARVEVRVGKEGRGGGEGRRRERHWGMVSRGRDECPCCVEGWVQNHILSPSACVVVDNLTYRLQLHNDWSVRCYTRQATGVLFYERAYTAHTHMHTYSLHCCVCSYPHKLTWGGDQVPMGGYHASILPRAFLSFPHLSSPSLEGGGSNSTTGRFAGGDCPGLRFGFQPHSSGNVTQKPKAGRGSSRPSWIRPRTLARPGRSSGRRWLHEAYNNLASLCVRESGRGVGGIVGARPPSGCRSMGRFGRSCSCRLTFSALWPQSPCIFCSCGTSPKSGKLKAQKLLEPDLGFPEETQDK